MWRKNVTSSASNCWSRYRTSSIGKARTSRGDCSTERTSSGDDSDSTQGDAAGALADFEAALTYPTNLNVGRSDKPIEAPAQYWRGQALKTLNRTEEARAAWQAGADGADVEGWQNEYREKCRAALGS